MHVHSWIIVRVFYAQYQATENVLRYYVTRLSRERRRTWPPQSQSSRFLAA